VEFEWDPEKEQQNIENHGIHFETAEYIFDDPLRVERRQRPNPKGLGLSE
jgi:uncharacterized DUF497 family protein